MAGPEDVRIVPAPLALRGKMSECARATFAAHNARQPFAFPQDRCATAVRNVELAFLDGRRELPESPNAFVAMAGEAFAGYVLLSAWARPSAPPMPYVCIEDVYVAEDFRRRGIGTMLVDHVKRLAVERDWDDLTATVWDWNAGSEALFRGSGFTRQSTTYRFGPDRQARNHPDAPGFWQQLGLWDRVGSVALCAFAFFGAFTAFRSLFDRVAGVF